MEVDFRGANVRLESSGTSRLLRRLQPKHRVEVVGYEHGQWVSDSDVWYRVRLDDGTFGLVASSLLRPPSEPLRVKREAEPAADFSIKGCGAAWPPELEDSTITVYFELVELNDQEPAEWILSSHDAACCGSAGCDCDYQQVLTEDGEMLSPPLRCNSLMLGAEMHGGYPDLVCHNQSMGIHDYSVVRWNGSAYRTAPPPFPGVNPLYPFEEKEPESEPARVPADNRAWCIQRLWGET